MLADPAFEPGLAADEEVDAGFGVVSGEDHLSLFESRQLGSAEAEGAHAGGDRERDLADAELDPRAGGVPVLGAGTAPRDQASRLFLEKAFEGGERHADD